MDNSLQRRLPQELELSVYEVARKEIVLKQDTYCNHLYVLLKGELEVNIVDVAGNLVKVEDIRAPRAFATPHLFGDKNLLPATFTASEDSVLLMATRTSVFKLISSVPDLLHRFLCVTGNCNKCTVTRLRILSYKMLRSRLVYYFMEHKISPDTALLEHNQVQLAEYLGVTRPALSKEINKMMKEGLISINKKVVTLEDMAALKEYISNGICYRYRFSALLQILYPSSVRCNPSVVSSFRITLLFFSVNNGKRWIKGIFFSLASASSLRLISGIRSVFPVIVLYRPNDSLIGRRLCI